MRTNVNELKEIRTDIDDLKQGQKRLEDGQIQLQKNLVDGLGEYSQTTFLTSR
ncbi:hypothetical protein [Gracilibacillus sp. YIM 98692]|uniref:hypothetical protein n=1 Tax=Gracilibacillus sp. YIM 98692 TaxID=2663532 RepID=UPI0013D5A868|nr:hypothetical protein [Gracilibacillus sp. YIM 98692]